MAETDVNESAERRRMELFLETRLDLEQFRAAIQVDAFRPIRLVAAGAHFKIEGQMKTEPRPKPKTKDEIEAAAEREMEECMTLCTSRKKVPRRFRNPAAALQLLRQIGAMKVEVQMQSWYPERAKLYADVKRPDMAARLTRAHEAARLEALARWEGEGEGSE